MAAAINAIGDRIGCHRADSCNYLCLMEGAFDGEVLDDLCQFMLVVPEAQIGCEVYGV